MTLSRTMLAYVFAITAVALPVLANAYLPLVDIPNHIARHFIAANPESALNRYYDYHLDLTPNSAVDLLWHITQHPFEPILFSKIVFAVYAANLVISAIVLARVVQGKWLMWPAASALLVYNAPFSWGFQNYLFTVPFALYGLALWLYMERFSNWLRIAVFIPYSLLLFWMHLFAFILLAIAALGRELQRVIASGKPWPKTLFANISLSIPFLVTAALLAYVILTSPPNPASMPSEFGGLIDRLALLISPLGESSGNSGVVMSPIGIAVYGVLLLLFYFGARRQTPSLKIADQMKGPLFAVLLVCLLIPTSINGVHLVHIRYPFVLLVLFIAATKWHGLTRKSTLALVLVIGASLVFRGIDFHLKASTQSREMAELQQVLKNAPKGARILPIRTAGNERDSRFWHVQAYAVPMAESYVPTLFQGVHSLRLKPEWSDSAHPTAMSIDRRRILNSDGQIAVRKSDDSEVFWDNWIEKYTHVLVLDAITDDWPNTPVLRKLSQNGRFSLYEIEPEN